MEKMKTGFERVRRVVEDDPRRVIHAMKVGVAVSLVSLFYYSQTLYNDFGSSAIWAVLTVIVVFEFSVGATLGKGLNRAMATLVGGALGFGAHSLASHCGYIGEPFLLGFFVFIQASVATFIRFFPTIKARYDYGFMVSILTFSLISISGFRVDELMEMARARLATILIGVLGSVLISVIVFPVWAGEELHNLIATNLDKLGNSLEGFGIAFFEIKEENEAESPDLSSVLQGYKCALNTKHIEESLVNFAKWEPRHGQFRYRHPWKQYLALGGLIRECAFKVDALHAHFNRPGIKAPPLKLHHEIIQECNTMSSEAGGVLKGLSVALKAMNQPPSSVKAHVEKSKEGVKRLHNLLKSATLSEDCDLLQIVPASTAASMLTDIVNCIEKIAQCANELASFAHFKTNKLGKSRSMPKKVDQMHELHKIDSFKSTKENSINQDDKNSSHDITVNRNLDHVVITIDAGK